MGFLIPRRNARLILHDDYEGGEVTALLEITMRDYLLLKNLRANDEEQALRLFGDRFLKAWNLEGEDGQPLPCNGDGMMLIPLRLAVDILNAWQSAIETVPVPLARPSSNGLSSVEASMPMETLSANP